MVVCSLADDLEDRLLQIDVLQLCLTNVACDRTVTVYSQGTFDREETGAGQQLALAANPPLTSAKYSQAHCALALKKSEQAKTVAMKLC